MEIRIYHFIKDLKFFNSAYKQFQNAAPGKNEFYIYKPLNEKNNSLIFEKDNVHRVELSKSLFNSIPSGSVVFFHSIPTEILEFIPDIHKDIIIVAVIFGFEIYSDPVLYPRSIALDKITYDKFYKGDDSNFKHFMERIKQQTHRALLALHPYLPFKKVLIKRVRGIKKLNALKRVDYFALPYKEEYESEKSILKFTRPFFKFTYYPLEKIIDPNIPLHQDKDILLIGHSGFRNGNHLDILDKIKSFIPDNLKTVVPLSYGVDSYINSIKPTFLKEIKNVQLLEEFLPLEEYTSMLSRVSVAVFNNRRQQGMGNIVSLLYLGAKVFISEINSLYPFFKNNDILIFSYENQLTGKEALIGLTTLQIQHNRNILKEIFSLERLHEELVADLKKLMSEKV